jgi:hypothetical protein
MKLLLFLLLNLVVLNLYSQTSDGGMSQVMAKIVPLSPQASAFDKYGEYPISDATGLPEIQIPLYTISIGNYKLPLSLSFHSSGIKVQEIATTIGLGWVLNAGGIISRHIKGKCDKIHKMAFISEAQINVAQKNSAYTDSYWEALADKKTEDTESDRYSYKFHNQSGIFRYCVSNDKIQTIPYSPIIINEHNNGYKIIDVDGVIYYFTYEEKNRDYAISGNSETTSWFLTKIKLQNKNDSIIFKYKEGQRVLVSNLIEYMRQGTDYTAENKSYNDVYSLSPNVNFRERRFQLGYYDCASTLLSEIEWAGNIIHFDYLQDRLDYRKNAHSLDRLVCATVINENKEIIKHITFNNNNYIGYNPMNYRMQLKSIHIKKNSSKEEEVYKFTYNTINLPNYTFNEKNYSDQYCHEDYWGYYNGSNSVDIVPNSFSLSNYPGANREANPQYMQAGNIESITYPSGGQTVFNFETNCINDNQLIGGLRIKSIINKNSDGQIINTKTYEYNNGYATMPISSELYSYMSNYIYGFTNTRGLYIHNSSHQLIATSSPLLPLSADNGYPVFYQQITEYIGTKDNNKGKIISEYFENRVDVSSFEDNDHSSEPIEYYSTLYNIDRGNIGPLLSLKKIYSYTNGFYELKKTERYSYKETTRDAFRLGVRFNKKFIFIYLGLNSYYSPNCKENFNEMYAYSDVWAIPSTNVLCKKEVIDNETKLKIDESYLYDDSLRILSPIEILSQQSCGSLIRTKKVYPFNIKNEIYNSMTRSNKLPVIKELVYKENQCLNTISYDYRMYHENFFLSSISSTKSGSEEEEKVDYQQYDSYGNPSYIIKKDNDKTVYLWSYKGQYPIAEIKNASYEQVITSLGNISVESLSLSNSPNMEKINQLRFKLPQALVTTYTYQPLVGMTSSTDPSGLTTYYDYDDFNRLKRAYIKEKDSSGNEIEKNIQTYDYHYKNQ